MDTENYKMDNLNSLEEKMGLIKRMNRIFASDGKALIVAMDHAGMDGPCQGLEDPGKTIQSIVAGGADAILTTYGVVRHFSKELAKIGVILRTDGGATALTEGSFPSRLFFPIEDALRFGADAVAVNAYPGGEREAETLQNLAHITSEAHKWGLPVLAEMVPGGFNSSKESRTTENVSISARIGSELGADIIKTPYTPNFNDVVSKCYVPVVILGGSKRGKERDMLADIKSAIDAGASGVAIGRNIWQADDPRAMTAAIAAIIHHNASVEEAMEIMFEKVYL